MTPGPPPAGRVALRFDTLGLVLWPGIFGMLPTFIWPAALFYPLSLVKSPALEDGGLGVALMVVLTATGMFIVLIGPGLAAGLVQRARQPQPARIEWDEDKVVEWNGDWARTTIPWSRLHGVAGGTAGRPRAGGQAQGRTHRSDRAIGLRRDDDLRDGRFGALLVDASVTDGHHRDIS
jgi:hypothetical protein